MKYRTNAEILNAVYQVFKVKPKDLIARNNGREISEIRHLTAYLMVEYGKESLPKVADFFERDRTTTINSVNVIKNLLSINDKRIIEKINKIEAFF